MTKPSVVPPEDVVFEEGKARDPVIVPATPANVVEDQPYADAFMTGYLTQLTEIRKNMAGLVIVLKSEIQPKVLRFTDTLSLEFARPLQKKEVIDIIRWDNGSLANLLENTDLGECIPEEYSIPRDEEEMKNYLKDRGFTIPFEGYTQRYFSLFQEVSSKAIVFSEGSFSSLLKSEKTYDTWADFTKNKESCLGRLVKYPHLNGNEVYQYNSPSFSEDRLDQFCRDYKIRDISDFLKELQYFKEEITAIRNSTILSIDGKLRTYLAKKLKENHPELFI